MAGTTHLNMTKIAAGNTSWTADAHAALDTVDLLHAPSKVYSVSPAFTAAALGNVSASDRRHFDTIQAAVNAAQNVDNTWGSWNSPNNIIMVYPGEYAENIVITGSIAIIGAVPNRLRADNRLGAKITGDGTVQSPIFTITPQDGVAARVLLSNLNIDTFYNQNTSDGVLIDKAHLIDFQAASSYDTVENSLTLDRIDAIANPRGTNNLWKYGIKVRGSSKLNIYDSEMRFSDYSNTANRGHKYAISVMGSESVELYSLLQVSSSKFQHEYRAGGYPAECALFHGGSGGLFSMHGCFFSRDGLLVEDNEIGTSSYYGTNAEDLALYGNFDGIDAVYF